MTEEWNVPKEVSMELNAWLSRVPWTQGEEDPLWRRKKRIEKREYCMRERREP